MHDATTRHLHSLASLVFTEVLIAPLLLRQDDLVAPPTYDTDIPAFDPPADFPDVDLVRPHT